MALDAQLTGKTFAIVMFDPDTPATGIGGNGTNSFLHWFQDGLTSDVASLVVGGNSTNAKTVFPLKNVGNINAIQPYVYVFLLLVIALGRNITDIQQRPRSPNWPNSSLYSDLDRYH